MSDAPPIDSLLTDARQAVGAFSEKHQRLKVYCARSLARNTAFGSCLNRRRENTARLDSETLSAGIAAWKALVKLLLRRVEMTSEQRSEFRSFLYHYAQAAEEYCSRDGQPCPRDSPDNRPGNVKARG